MRLPRRPLVFSRTAQVHPADVLDERGLQRLSNRELDLLFRSSPAGPIPHGRLPGTVLLFPGSRFCGPLARLARLLLWQGKVTDDQGGSLKNLVGPWHVRTIKALLSHDTSWVDGRECVLIDYSTTSRVAHMVRDEIRQVSPARYLGVVWLWKRRVAWFALRQQ
jgi:hypothetical protein